MTATSLPFPSTAPWRRWLPALAWVLGLGGMASILVLHIESVQAARGIQGGFGFLFQPAGFRISESLLNVTPEHPYWMSLAAGLVNTLTVAVVAIPLATVLGAGLGFMGLSSNPLAARTAALVIAPLRNTPVLLQLFVWYGLLLRLPDLRQAWSPLPSVLLSNRGLALPALHGGRPYAGVAGAALALGWRARRRWSGSTQPAALAAALAAVLAAAGIAWAQLPPMQIDLPIRRGLGVHGGWQPSIEFAALTIGLVVFHAAYIADIVRGAVRAVPVGLVEAGQSMGLTPSKVLRLVIAPYATRVALPPYANQCLALIKNSTLAIAIGYQELMAVINTAITQTGLALEGIALAVAVHLALAALTLHTACVLAEVLRGALQAIPPGQMMAARALGMRPALAYACVIWPQARRIAAPAALGVFVGAVKDTSLVSIIGVFDVLGAAKAVVAGTDWRPYHVEVYLAVALLYLAASLALSGVARRMEGRGKN